MVPSHPRVGSQLSLTPLSKTVTTTSNVFWNQAHTCFTDYVRVEKALIKINFKILNNEDEIIFHVLVINILNSERVIYVTFQFVLSYIMVNLEAEGKNKNAQR